MNTTIVRWAYSSAITTNSGSYSPTGCSVVNYYEALELNNSKLGTYRFSSNSTIGLRGSIYLTSFDPLYPSSNLLAEKSGELGFQLNVPLVDSTYILVVTSRIAGQTGSFSIVAYGPSKINARLISKFDCFVIALDLLLFFVHPDNKPLISHSIYSSAFTPENEEYYPYRCIIRRQYYQVFEINMTLPGLYVISSNSNFAISGILYRDRFDSIDPSLNQIATDANSCTNGQFRLETFLETNITYILVVATCSNDCGPYSIFSLGEGPLSFTRLGKSSCHQTLIW